MIGSQALVSLMAGGLLSTMEQHVWTGGPEVAIGTIAIAILTVMALAAALRADWTTREKTSSAAPAAAAIMLKAGAPFSLSAVKEPSLRLPKSGIAKKQAVKIVARPDSRRPSRAPSSPAAKRYRPANMTMPRSLRQDVTSPAAGSARGLLLFVERRAARKTAKAKMA